MDASLRVKMAVFKKKLSIDYAIGNITPHYVPTIVSPFHRPTMVDVAAIDNGSGNANHLCHLSMPYTAIFGKGLNLY